MWLEFYVLSHCPLSYRIDVNFVIKVADFGLAESLDHDQDYYHQDDVEGVKMPMKWLAPESLKDGLFSQKSDVVCPVHGT